jgi:S1-C subfamily serine protease
MLDATTCFRCDASVPRGSRFCGTCGADLVHGRPRFVRVRRLRALVVVGAVAVLAALVLSALALATKRTPTGAERAAERARADAAASRAAVAYLNRRVKALAAQNARLAGSLSTTQKRVRASAAGLTPLANRILKSVFTVEAGRVFGSGFAAWTQGGDLYVITADHVVAGLVRPYVNVTHKKQSWGGEVVATDAAGDLAVIRVSGRIPGAAPLWQRADRVRPKTGDELLLVGSPYGLEGSVTTGIVSRVTPKLIQTDAAANPGNSGGPALTRDGQVVGVLVAGGGENINFAIPIGRACTKVRRCR